MASCYCNLLLLFGYLAKQLYSCSSECAANLHWRNRLCSDLLHLNTNFFPSGNVRGWGCKAQASFFCGTFRFGWVFPTQEPGFLFRVLLPFIFPSMVFIVFVTFCVLVRNPLPYDSIGCLHSHLQQSTWNQKVHRRQSTHCRIYFTPHDLTDTENLILKKKMAALEKRCVRAVHAHAFRGVRQPACAMSRQSVAQL